MLFDVQAPLQVERLMAASNLDQCTRRVSRVATLDQSASFYDAGYTPADRTLSVAVAVTGRDDPLLALAKYYLQSYSELSVTLKDDAYIGVIDRVNFANDMLVMNILLKRTATE